MNKLKVSQLEDIHLRYIALMSSFACLAVEASILEMIVKLVSVF